MAIEKIKLTSETASVTQNKINANFEELDLDRATKENIFRYSTMPVASSTNVGKIIQFVGTTNTYTNGYFYKCVLNNGNYEWEQVNVQPHPTLPTKTSDLTNDGDGNSPFATESYVAINSGKIDSISVNGTTQTIDANKNVDLSVIEEKPDGTNNLISNNKINTTYLPDYILGQVLYGGNLNASNGVVSLSDNAKSKLGTSSNTITLTNDTTAITGYIANEGIYYVTQTAGTLFGTSFEQGDWLISNGNSWQKIDNTDAVTGVKGNAELNYRIGNVNITASNVGAVSYNEAQTLTVAQQTQALNNAGSVGRKYYVNNSAQGEVFNATTGAVANIASGNYSHAEGSSNTASGNNSHAEGYNNTASNFTAHAEGSDTEATAYYSHAEGYKSKAITQGSHAEGYTTTASGLYSHAEGSNTTASGDYSHAEGAGTTASGDLSHAQGYDTTAGHAYSFASGFGTQTGVENQTVIGKYNVGNNDTLFEIGNGTGSSSRTNIFQVKDNGDIESATGVIKQIGQTYGVVAPAGLTQNETILYKTEYSFTSSDASWSALTNGYYTLTIPSSKIPFICFNSNGVQIMCELSYDGTNIYVKTDTKFSGKVIAI